MGILSSFFNSGADKPAEPPKESWSVAQTTHNGRPMFLRINTSLKPIAGKPPFQDRFGVAVPLLEPNEHGLPTPAESEQLNQIEDTLTAAFTSSGKTLYAVAITTNGFREFVFYTSVPRDIVPAMERLTKEVTTHKLQFYIKPDKNWEVYRSFAG